MSTPMGRDEVLAVLDENIGTHGEICADFSCNVIAHTRQASAAVVAIYERCEALERAVEKKDSVLTGISRYCRVYKGIREFDELVFLVTSVLAYTGTEPSDAEGGG